MKKLIFVFILCISTASTGYPKNKLPVEDPNYFLKQLELTVRITDEEWRIGRLANWLAKNTRVAEPFYVATLLCRTKHPAELAGILKEEANPLCNLVGPDGELGPFQLMWYYRPKNYDPYNWEQNVKLAEAVLDEKIALTGSLRSGVKAWNGIGKPADRYRRRVLSHVSNIALRRLFYD